MEFVSAVIVGSGSSSSTPALRCAVASQPCASCAAAMRDVRSPNHRLNPCFLLQLRHPRDRTLHNVLIDCGKTFREAALKVFPALHVRDLSALLITHDHADACFGADDLREFVRDDTTNGLDVYADERTLATMRRVFTYLFPKEGAEVVDRRNYRQCNTNWTATIDWHRMPAMVRTDIAIQARAGCGDAGTAAWPFVAIPVLHGPNYYSNAFLFRLDRENGDAAPRLLLYVSDISQADDAFYRSVEDAKQALLTSQERAVCGGQRVGLEVVLLDMLSMLTYISHLSVDESIEVAKVLNATHTYFIGFAHSLEHESLTRLLQQRGVGDRMHVGYDGCVVARADVQQA